LSVNIDNEGIAYPYALNVKYWIKDENIAQFFGLIAWISKNAKGIDMKLLFTMRG
jgi:hypothetical protein